MISVHAVVPTASYPRGFTLTRRTSLRLWRRFGYPVHGSPFHSPLFKGWLLRSQPSTQKPTESKWWTRGGVAPPVRNDSTENSYSHIARQQVLLRAVLLGLPFSALLPPPPPGFMGRAMRYQEPLALVYRVPCYPELGYLRSHGNRGRGGFEKRHGVSCQLRCKSFHFGT